MSETPPAGWYPDPSGALQQRYWDGSQWTDHFAGPVAGGEAPGDTGLDETGELIAGDGVSAPLYEFRASRLAGGRMITPNVVRIWPDRVEEYEHHAVRRKNTKAISYGQVAQVVVNRGLRWTHITVESTGGHVIKLLGVPKARADQVKALLDGKVHDSKVGIQAQPSAPIDVADQLRRLADLRDQGIMSDEEFAAQKAKLLS